MLIPPNTQILVVDDNPFLLRQAAYAVIEAGYSAVPVTGTQEALDVLGSDADIAVLVTDMGVRGQGGGIGLAFAAREMRPAIGVVLTSDRPALPNWDLPAGARLLRKPASRTDLAATLNATLAAAFAAQ
jgi:CheY-like chemotaxis protein